MKTLVCKKRCFYNDTLFHPGDLIKVDDGMKSPAHFEVVKAKASPETGEPLADMLSPDGIAGVVRAIFKSDKKSDSKKA